MQFSKGIVAQNALRKNMEQEDAFTNLVACIEALPTEQRGPQALSLSASLLELAAYEMAGSVASADVAAMIETAAALSRRSCQEVKAHAPLEAKADRRLN